MKLIEVDIKSISKARNYRKGFLKDLIEEFIHSGMEAAEVDHEDYYKNSYTAYKAICNAINKNKYQVKVMYSKHADKIWLIRKEDEDA